MFRAFKHAVSGEVMSEFLRYLVRSEVGLFRPAITEVFDEDGETYGMNDDRFHSWVSGLHL